MISLLRINIVKQHSCRGISSALIKELRERSNAPILDCKNALLASDVNGDISKAMDWLRAKGIARASNQVCRRMSLIITLMLIFFPV